jgi:hypothetical protein
VRREVCRAVWCLAVLGGPLCDAARGGWGRGHGGVMWRPEQQRRRQQGRNRVFSSRPCVVCCAVGE